MTDKEYWNQEMETLPSDRLRGFQKERLQKAIEWAYSRKPSTGIFLSVLE